MPQVEVTFYPDGTVTTDVIGEAGKGCEAIQKILDCVGKTVEEEKKPEYFQGDGVTRVRQSRG